MKKRSLGALFLLLFTFFSPSSSYYFPSFYSSSSSVSSSLFFSQIKHPGRRGGGVPKSQISLICKKSWPLDIVFNFFTCVNMK